MWEWQWEVILTLPTTNVDNGPSGVALDRACNIYVAATQDDHILKLSPDGTLAGTFGSSGSAPGQFKQPRGVAVDALGNIWATDTGNNRVQKLSPTGAALDAWGKCANASGCQPDVGSKDGEFYGPEGIAVDGQGAVYVADGTNHRVQKASSSGPIAFVPWGGTKPNNAFDVLVRNLTVDGQGNVYVVEGERFTDVPTRVDVFDSSGKLMNQRELPPGNEIQSNRVVRGVGVDSDGNIYMTDTYENRIVKVAPNGEVLTQWRHCLDDPDVCQLETSGNEPGQFFQAFGLVVDGQGNLYVADSSNNRVQRFIATAVPVPNP